MKSITIVTQLDRDCPFCDRTVLAATGLAARPGTTFTKKEMTREQLVNFFDDHNIESRTIPQVFVNSTHVGGWTEFRQWIIDNEFSH